jgi:predicted PurR-regulated permease PerM
MATDLLGGGVDFFQGLFLVVLYMLFIFAEQAVFRHKIVSVSGERGEDAARVLDTIGRGVQSYLGVKTVISLTTGVLVYVALLFLEVPFALLFGLMAFLLNYIPVFGSIIAGIFPTALVLVTEESLTLPLTVASIYIVVNVVMAYLIEPKLFGRELNLSPLVILVSVIVWTGIWGVPGTFLSVPLTAAIQIVLANIPRTRPVAILLSSGIMQTKAEKSAAKSA